MPQKNKEMLIREFQQMMAFEKWAGDFYLQVALNPKIENEEIKEIFRKIADYAGYHANTGNYLQ